MKSKYTITNISNSDKPAVHAYYDVCPESPSGTDVIYSQWVETNVPGKAQVVFKPNAAKATADTISALSTQAISEPRHYIGHVGAFPAWCNESTLAYITGVEADADCIFSDLEGNVHNVDIHGRFRAIAPESQCVGVLNRPLRISDSKSLLTQVNIMDLNTGQTLGKWTTEEAYAMNPLAEPELHHDKFQFQNIKFSPDESQFLVVFNTEVYRKHVSKTVKRVKSIYVGNTDGSEFRYLGEFGHHPKWSPDGKGIIAYVTHPDKPQDLYYYPSNGVTPYVIWESSPGCHPTMSPCGTKIITDTNNSPEPGKGQILCHDLKKNTTEILAEFTHTKYDHSDGHHIHPVYSRDHESIYFNSMDTGISQVYRLDLK